MISLFGMLVIFFVIYGITLYLKNRNEELIQRILSNPVESKGIVVSFTSYKGKGATINYSVNGQRFEIKPSVTNEFFNNTSIGDSVALVYSKKKPEEAVLKYKLTVAKD